MKRSSSTIGTNPLRRVGEPEDSGRGCVSRPTSSYVTGEFLVVDGGFLT
jgi:NAD(P)-dependent dehydrogenase (short-subunit alcohol dehydrogenase family)